MPLKKLPVLLTDEELRMRGAHLAAHLEELSDARHDAKRTAEAFKEQRSTLELEISRLKTVILQRSEMREVEILEEKDWLEKTVSTVRLDTGEVIETRPMTMEERNRPLPFEPEEAGEASA